MADNQKELDGLGKELLDVMERLQSAWSARSTALAEKEMQLQTVQNELAERAQNVVRMEKSIREHMKQKTDLEERLSSASSKQNTAFLKMQIMEGEPLCIIYLCVWNITRSCRELHGLSWMKGRWSQTIKDPQRSY